MPLPESLPWMEGFDAKIRRAQEHLNAFFQEGRSFVHSTNRFTVPKTDGKSTWLVSVANDAYPPPRLSAIVGDCIFNMRSSLDNLVCGLARKKRPDCRCIGIRFPIYSDPDKWQEHWKCDLKGVPGPARAIIKGLQPCFRSDGLAKTDPLAILNELSNIDKHRSILLTTVYDHDLSFFVTAKDGTVHGSSVDGRVHGTDVQIIPLGILPDNFPDKPHVRIEGTSVITFAEHTSVGEASVYKVLLTCLNYIKEGVVPSLKPFFS